MARWSLERPFFRIAEQVNMCLLLLLIPIHMLQRKKQLIGPLYDDNFEVSFPSLCNMYMSNDKKRSKSIRYFSPLPILSSCKKKMSQFLHLALFFFDARFFFFSFFPPFEECAFIISVSGYKVRFFKAFLVLKI